jgi:pyruvate dehydrogenase E1 component alpha subunit
MSYIPPEELEAKKAADPVPRFADRLVEDGVLTPEQAAEIEEQGRQQVEDALVEVLASPSPTLDALDRDVYAAAKGR